MNTRRGTVRLSSVTSTGKLQTGDFNGGVFQVRQARAQPRPDRRQPERLELPRLHCARQPGRGGRRAVWSGESAAGRAGVTAPAGATARRRVRGTTWTVTDRCDGTLTSVTSGTVTVRDFRRKRNVTVHAHRSYLARAG